MADILCRYLKDCGLNLSEAVAEGSQNSTEQGMSDEFVFLGTRTATQIFVFFATDALQPVLKMMAQDV